MAWTYELLVHGNGGKWSRVEHVLPDQGGGHIGGPRQVHAWTMCEDYRVVEVDEPANYRIVEGRFQEIPPA